MLIPLVFNGVKSTSVKLLPVIGSTSTNSKNCSTILKLFTSIASIYFTHNENCSTKDVSVVSSASTVKHLALLTLVTSLE